MNTMNAKFCKALAGFSQEVPAIHKNTKGYGYSYSNLSEIFSVINPLLKKHGLGFTQIVNGTSLTTIVFHVESGETIEGTMDIPQGVQLKGMNEFQVYGSAISYLKRYHISGILCLVTDSDIDASGVQTKPSKAVITDARFKKAMEAILAGDYTREELEAKYSLTNKQKKSIES
tara:strand:+ start:713 stop:1234 length:522 start_codon:yes stop_codon:yes gene_type:complete